MSDLPGSKTQAVLTRMWLESLVGCDCDNGERTIIIQNGTLTTKVPCDRCVLVEVGGIRVRALRHEDLATDEQVQELVLPAVEVTNA